MSRPARTPLRSSTLALAAATGLACASAQREPEREAPPEPATPSPATPSPATPSPATPNPAPVEPPQPALPEPVARAVATLLSFRERSPDELAAAHRVVLDVAAPERYEERGEAQGRPYVYTREHYPTLGLTIHLDGARISNVERTGTGG